MDMSTGPQAQIFKVAEYVVAPGLGLSVISGIKQRDSGKRLHEMYDIQSLSGKGNVSWPAEDLLRHHVRTPLAVEDFTAVLETLVGKAKFKLFDTAAPVSEAGRNVFKNRTATTSLRDLAQVACDIVAPWRGKFKKWEYFPKDKRKPVETVIDTLASELAHVTGIERQEVTQQLRELVFEAPYHPRLHKLFPVVQLPEASMPDDAFRAMFGMTPAEAHETAPVIEPPAAEEKVVVVSPPPAQKVQSILAQPVKAPSPTKALSSIEQALADPKAFWDDKKLFLDEIAIITVNPQNKLMRLGRQLLDDNQFLVLCRLTLRPDMHRETLDEIASDLKISPAAVIDLHNQATARLRRELQGSSLAKLHCLDEKEVPDLSSVPAQTIEPPPAPVQNRPLNNVDKISHLSARLDDLNAQIAQAQQQHKTANLAGKSKADMTGAASAEIALLPPKGPIRRIFAMAQLCGVPAQPLEVFSRLKLRSDKQDVATVAAAMSLGEDLVIQLHDEAASRVRQAMRDNQKAVVSQPGAPTKIRPVSEYATLDHWVKDTATKKQRKSNVVDFQKAVAAVAEAENVLITAASEGTAPVAEQPTVPVHVRVEATDSALIVSFGIGLNNGEHPASLHFDFQYASNGQLKSFTIQGLKHEPSTPIPVTPCGATPG